MNKKHPKEIENVLNMSDPDRYDYFIKWIADREEVWALQGLNGWFGLGDSQDNEYIPFWPYRDYVDLFVSEDKTGYTPVTINLYEWMEKWLDVEESRFGIVIFPKPNGKGIIVDRQRILYDLQVELEQYDYDNTYFAKADRAKEMAKRIEDKKINEQETPS